MLRPRIHKIRTAAIDQAWKEGKVVVVAGFQGVTANLSLTTLGRGGSDTSAVALAVALKAAFCEINTDVDGVFTTDPRIEPNARLIEQLDFESALEMASLGSKVLHPRSVELAAKHGMPLIVRNSFKPDNHPRTTVMATVDATLEALAVTGITLDRDVAKVTVTGLADSRESHTRYFWSIGRTRHKCRYNHSRST